MSETTLLPFIDLRGDAQVTGTSSTGEPVLLAARCGSCGTAWFPMHPACPTCAARAPAEFPIGPGGSLYSFTAVHVSSARETPYTLGYVDTDQGVRVLSIVRGDVDALTVDGRCSLGVDDDGQWWFSQEGIA